MKGEGLRVAAIAFFALAAALAGIGNVHDSHWLVALAFACFGAGAISFLRWRAATRGKVLASEMKTMTPEIDPPAGGPEARDPDTES